jgi:hypothetical protein
VSLDSELEPIFTTMRRAWDSSARSDMGPYSSAENRLRQAETGDARAPLYGTGTRGLTPRGILAQEAVTDGRCEQHGLRAWLTQRAELSANELQRRLGTGPS